MNAYPLTLWKKFPNPLERRGRRVNQVEDALPGSRMCNTPTGLQSRRGWLRRELGRMSHGANPKGSEECR